MNPHRKSLRLLGGVLVVYALLVATHLGEFWPFSIYPMFSQAGNPWSRAVVRELPLSSADPVPVSWDTVGVEGLSGRPFPLGEHDVDNIDLANFISKTTSWTPSRADALHRLFRTSLAERRLLIYRVNGRLESDGDVAVRFVPYVLLTPDASVVSPVLRPNAAAAFRQPSLPSRPAVHAGRSFP